MKTLKINWLAVVACVVLNTLISMFWYGVFSEAWLAGNKLSLEDVSGEDPLPYIFSTVAAIITFTVMAYMWTLLKVENLQRGILYGAIFGLAFMMFPLTTQHMFSMKPMTLTLIDGGSQVIIWTIAGGILGAWRKYN